MFFLCTVAFSDLHFKCRRCGEGHQNARKQRISVVFECVDFSLYVCMHTVKIVRYDQYLCLPTSVRTYCGFASNSPKFMIREFALQPAAKKSISVSQEAND